MAQGILPIAVVAVLTYRRQDMLRQLLRSLYTLDAPPGWQVRYLIVDNDSQASAKTTVNEFREAFGSSLTYVVEPEPGIPFARNRAIDEATRSGARLLCFIDDDDHPATDWLREMTSYFEKTGAVLIGGPTRLLMPSVRTNPWERFLARSLVARSKLMEKRSAKKGRAGKIDMIATNNWAASLVWIGSRTIRFDEDLRFSGGSDGKFFFQVVENSGQIGWCETAVVFEHISLERLKLRYHISRAFSQGLVLTQLRREKIHQLIPLQLTRIAFGTVIILIPLLGMGSFAIGTRMVANGCGRLAGLFRLRSALYLRSRAATNSQVASKSFLTPKRLNRKTCVPGKNGE